MTGAGGHPSGVAAGPSPAASALSCALLVMFGLVAAGGAWLVWALLPTATATYDETTPVTSYDSSTAAPESSYVWPSVWPRTCDNGRVVIHPEDLDCR